METAWFGGLPMRRPRLPRGRRGAAGREAEWRGRGGARAGVRWAAAHLVLIYYNLASWNAAKLSY